MKILTYIKILSLGGIILAIYLLWEQATKFPFAPCNINTTINCNAIVSGPVANTFGIPTPLIGLIGYIAIFFASLFDKKKLLITMATFGLIFCLWIGYKEIIELHVICPICILCQLLMISIFSMSIFHIKKIN